MSKLPDMTGTIRDLARVVRAEPCFQDRLDWGIVTGTKDQPRWRHSLKVMLQNHAEVRLCI
jgi:hypothetical protein